MTEISPRHRHTTAHDDDQPQSLRGDVALVVASDLHSGGDAFMGLLAELGVPEHFLADIDPSLLENESWDHIPDLEEDLEKGAKEVAFNFDWSWLQHDLANPGLNQKINPIVARGDWRSPPAPPMVRTRPEALPASQPGNQDRTLQASIAEVSPRLPDISGLPAQIADPNTLLVTKAPQDVLAPIGETLGADSRDDTPGGTQAVAASLPSQENFSLTALAPSDPVDAVAAETEVAPASFVPELAVEQGGIIASEWVLPMSVSTPLKPKDQKRQQTQLAAQARAEAKIAAKAARRQQKLEQAAEASLNRAALLLQRQSQREARQEARINMRVLRQQKYQAWMQSRMIQHQLPLMLRLSTGISAITLFSAGALWGGSQISWLELADISFGGLPRLEHHRAGASPVESPVIAAKKSGVTAMVFDSAAITPPPAPDMKVAPVPAPLPISASDPKVASPASIETSGSLAKPEPETAVDNTAIIALPENIAVDLPIDNAPADEKPLLGEIAELRRNAVAGNRQAQHDLGAFYAAGRQIERDFIRAAYWFREAAMRGVPNAQYNLGVLLQRGLGVPQDTAMATKWYQRAARNNHVEAQYNLGVAYADGIGVPKNPRVAAEWFEKAAVAGLARAAFNLGVMYELGMKGQADIDHAVRWYARAAEAGERDARESLDRLNIAEADIAGLAAELAQDLAVRYPTIAADASGDQPLNADQIAEVQSLLGDLGLYRGNADGQLGSKTVRAITSFQEKAGLPATGKATESLLAALRRQTGTENPF